MLLRGLLFGYYMATIGVILELIIEVSKTIIDIIFGLLLLLGCLGDIFGYYLGIFNGIILTVSDLPFMKMVLSVHSVNRCLASSMMLCCFSSLNVPSSPP